MICVFGTLKFIPKIGRLFDHLPHYSLWKLKSSNWPSYFCHKRCFLRWLPTVLTVRRPEEGWRTKNELFVSPLGLTEEISHTPGISFSLIWVCCRLLPWQQTILKITIFCLFSTYLLPFLELASVKNLETRQSRTSWDKFFLKNHIVKKAPISWTLQTFTKFHRRKHEKSELVFSSFASLWRHTISRRPRANAY